MMHLFSQYWYEGEELGELPLDFDVIWDGDFAIDKPPGFKGTSLEHSEF